jgi:hypothetical protein
LSGFSIRIEAWLLCNQKRTFEYLIHVRELSVCFRPEAAVRDFQKSGKKKPAEAAS